MPPVATSVRPSAPASSVPPPAPHKAPRRLSELPHATPTPPRRNATDDEILGLASVSSAEAGNDSTDYSKNRRGAPSPATTSSVAAQSSDSLDDALLANRAPDERYAEEGTAEATDPSADSADHTSSSDAIPAELQAVLDAHPDLRRAWDDRESYRQFFATPEEARAATAQLRDLDRMDTLFFSRRPEDHVELAAAVAALDPVAFASLAQAMNKLSAAPGSRSPAILAASVRPSVEAQSRQPEAAQSADAFFSTLSTSSNSGYSAAQSEFFHTTNAVAVESVLGAIESQVEKLLPEGVSKNARSRVVGEIYRELDTTLRSNRQFTQQLRDAMGSALAQPDGGRDANHQRAIVSLIAGRARQALPAVAKRVLNEWTSTIVAANHERRGRQRDAERRVDIAGSSGAGNSGRRPVSPREIDYARMSDADILNL
jgi:hypothetical protein